VMHPPSSSLRILHAKVSLCKQKLVPVIIRRVHHVPFTSHAIGRLRTRSPCVAISLDTHVGLNVATRFLLPCLESVQTVVLCRFWFQCSRSLIVRESDLVHRNRRASTLCCWKGNCE
jgi:hypothetical protein